MIEINEKLKSNKNIPIPNDLSKIVSYVRVTPPKKVPLYYKNYSNIDNIPKQNTKRNIEINYKTSNIVPKAKPKINKNLIKKYKDKLRIEDNYSKDQLETLKKNAKKAKKLNKLKLQKQLETLKKENAKKEKKKNLKNKINLDIFFKNSLKKYKEPKPKPKPKKKSIWDVIDFPKPLVI